MLKIFDDSIYNYIDENKQSCIDFLNNNDIEINDNNIEDAAIELIDNDYLSLNSAVNEYDNKADYSKILVIADLGLWYGRRQAQKTFKSLFNAIHICTLDNNIVYFDKKNTTLRLQSYHHDGVNNYKFYKIKNGKKYAINYNDIMSCY